MGSYDDLRVLFDMIPRLLRPSGRFSYFNGIASHTPLSYAVFSALAHCHLAAAGLRASFRAVPLDGTKDREVERTGASYSYFMLPFYLLPEIRFRADSESEPALDSNGACLLEFGRVFCTPPSEWLSFAGAHRGQRCAQPPSGRLTTGQA